MSTQYFTEVGQRLIGKWDKLLEGITDDSRKITTAILLENESQKGGMLTEDTVSGQSGGGAVWGQAVGNAANTAPYSSGNNVAPFQHYLLPLVRRVYPNLIANELVGIQPMTSPASLVFYLKYRYAGLNDGSGMASTAKGGTAPGTEYGNFSGNTWNIDPYYSLQTNWREVISTSQSPNDENFTAYTFLATPLIATAPVVVRWTGNAGGEYVTWKGPIGASTSALLFTFTSTSGTVSAITPGTITVTTTTVTAAGVNFTGATSTEWTIDVTYDYNMEGNRLLPEIELQVESQPVTAQTRKLRTKWTIEASQDLRAMHNIDAEQELVALLANEVTAEIDREIINDLITNANIRVDYDYSDPFLVGGSFSNVDTTPSPNGTLIAIPGSTNFADRNKALFYQILEVSNQIYRQSLRGAGNWVVTSPEIAAKLESLLEFKPDGRTDFTYSLGIVQSGSLNGQMKLFKDPLFPKNGILVGYKGNTFMDAGYFYCPYIPLQLTPTVLDPESFNPRKGLITRYGKVMVENGSRMYGYVKVANLTAIGANTLPGSRVTIDKGSSTVNGTATTFTAGITDADSDLI